MSNYQDRKWTQPPPRWLHCPRKSTHVIQNKFLAFKTPLSSNYDDAVQEACRWNVSWIFEYCKRQKLQMGLWIDLTNTTRFYNKQEIENQGCKYYKLSCRGHGETPSIEQTKQFIYVCQSFIRQHPLEIIGVHCTHGFNRTGFLICSFLIEDRTYEWPVDKALKEFAEARPPGIYKEDYIEELFKRYDDPSDWENFTQKVHPTPPRPAWCLEESEYEEPVEGSTSECSESTDPPTKKRKREFIKKKPVFMAGVSGVSVVEDYAKMTGIQKRVQQICSWKSNGFPGCQPVSMDRSNIKLLGEKPYMVSWKADGTRYMMLIESDGEMYFVDRDNSIFQVSGLTFPDIRDLRKRLHDTLLDGEMVIDKVNGKDCPRYLVYDIIMYNGKDVSKLDFHPTRFNIIEREIYGARTLATQKGLLCREREPFSVRAKSFWDVTQASRLLSEKFAKQLCHEPDGLIFQPAKEPYVTGQCDEVLKWKPETHNSVDFKLKITQESGVGMLSRKIGELYVGGLSRPFGTMKITKSTKDLDGKIIECVYENNQWVFMRERTDKSFPNSYKTASSVCGTICNPVTKDGLLRFIEKIRVNKEEHRQNDMRLMPPPPQSLMF